MTGFEEARQVHRSNTGEKHALHKYVPGRLLEVGPVERALPYNTSQVAAQRQILLCHLPRRICVFVLVDIASAKFVVLTAPSGGRSRVASWWKTPFSFFDILLKSAFSMLPVRFVFPSWPHRRPSSR